VHHLSDCDGVDPEGDGLGLFLGDKRSRFDI
jgi:hypothetical protein